MPEHFEYDLLSHLSYALDEGYDSAHSLYNQATGNTFSSTLGYVNNWVNKQPTNI